MTDILDYGLLTDVSLTEFKTAIISELIKIVFTEYSINFIKMCLASNQCKIQFLLLHNSLNCGSH